MLWHKKEVSMATLQRPPTQPESPLVLEKGGASEQG